MLASRTLLIANQGVWKTKFYASDGRKLALLAYGALRAESLGCPSCGYRWKKYDKTSAAPAVSSEIRIVETERSEEFFGENRRVIDNLGSSPPLTRSFSFSKEWSRTIHLEVERANSDGAELTLGAKDTAALRLNSEEKLRRTYSVSEDAKGTSSEDVSCQVQARQKLIVAVRWKRIWQHGFVWMTRDDITLKIPFHVVVGVTFDQRQTEESE